MNKIALFLFDYTTNVAKPWREAGYETLSVDIQHPLRDRGSHILNVDLTTTGPLLVELKRRGIALDDIAFLGCFPVCTHVAVSGARDFKIKGLRALAQAVQFFATCREMAELVSCEWFIENPVSSMASHWRKPNFYFHPCDYAGLFAEDNYTKKTSLWTSPGFVMPSPVSDTSLGPPDVLKIVNASPSHDRWDVRSAFPAGFSRAVFEANKP